MLLYIDDAFSEHDTGRHPECPERIIQLNRLLRREKWHQRANCPAWQPANRTELERVHKASYIDQLEQWCLKSAGRVEADTVVSKGSWAAANRAAGAAIDAVRRVIKGETATAFCAIRPPGHHALVGAPMGFCLFNNIAIAAHAALAEGLHRVLVVDWDVHHGNGTQNVFYNDGRVGFFSIHRSPFYPGTGDKSESGSGPGLGWIRNEPVAASIKTPEFTERFTRALDDLATKVRPELILLSAGFDAHQADPVGSLCLVDEDYADLTKIVMQVAASYCSGRIVSLLEGGYHLDHMPRSALQHVTTLASGV